MIRIIIPQDIAAFRADRGWSQARLAQRIGATVRTVQDWEGGRRTPPYMLSLVFHHIVMIEKLEDQVRLMRDRSITVRSGKTDVTDESVSQAENTIAEYKRLLGLNVWEEPALS